MPQPPIKRTQIRDALKTLLETITGANYYNDLSESVFVWRPETKEPYGPEELPAVNIRDLNQTKVGEQMAAPVNNWEWQLDVEVGVAASSAAEFTKVIADVLAAINGDRFLGGLLFNLTVTEIPVDVNEEELTLQGGTIKLQLFYNANQFEL